MLRPDRGRARSGGVRALALHPTANLSDEPDRFEIDPAAHLRLSRGRARHGREIVGCYHSHPHGRAAPSARDRENAGEDDFVWLIAALAAQPARPNSPPSPAGCSARFRWRRA